MAEIYNATYVEVSAFDNLRITDVFYYLTTEAIQYTHDKDTFLNRQIHSNKEKIMSESTPTSKYY